MGISLTAHKFDETTRDKDVRLFHYASTTVDLLDGSLVEADLSVSTYGLGKACKKSVAGTPIASVIGPVDAAVDASAITTGGFSALYRTIPIVVAGVKADVQSDGSTTAGQAQMNGAAAGQATDMTNGHEHQVFGVALEADAANVADMLIYPRWIA